jgi:archaeosine-15-forming tRNA-guanine transglycosylase
MTSEGRLISFEGRATIEGEWAGRVTGLGDQGVEIAIMRMPDGRLELSASSHRLSSRITATPR